MICCFWSSSRHATQAGVSKLKIILLYFVMVSLWLLQALLLFSCSFDRVYTTFLQVLTKTSCSFIISLCNRRQVTKIFLTFLHLKNQSHQSTYCIAGFLHWCIYTFQHIPKDDNFHLVCRQNQSLTQLLHCRTCHMEHLNHENLSLCVLSTFSTCHERTCLLLLSVLSPVFQIALTQPHSKSFCIEPPVLFPQRHWMTLYRQSFSRIVTHHN